MSDISNKLKLYDRRMVNINGDLRERVIYQRHLAFDIFSVVASGIIQQWLEAWASGIIDEDYILAAPSTRLTHPHYIYSLDVDIVPDASGTRDLGTVSDAFDVAYIDRIYLEADPITPLQAATKQYVDSAVQTANEFIELTDTPSSYAGMAASGVRVNATTNGLEFYHIAASDLDTLQTVTDRGPTTTNAISTAGITVSSDILASASGTIDIGSVSLAFNDAYIDKVYLEADPTDPLQAATKQYVDGAVEGENLWDRSGTTLIPHTASDDVQLGDSTTDAGTLIIVKGAQTGDPQVELALSANASGDFSITTDTGDIDLVAAGGDLDIDATTIDISTQATVLSIKDNESSALDIREGSNSYLEFQTTDNDEKIVLNKGLEIGILSVAEDGGALKLVDMNVTTAPASGAEESYSLEIDDNVILKIYSEADGVGGIQNAGLQLENSAIIANKKNTDVDTGTETVDSFLDTIGDAVVWHYVIKNTSNLRAGTVISCWDASGDTIEYAETTTNDVGDTSDVTLAVDISSDWVRLRATTISDDWEVRVLRILI